MNILVVEDDVRLAESIRMYLKKMGHEVSWVTDGRKGLKALEIEEYDGVISDVQMPRGNGIELLQEIWCTLDSPPPFYVHSSEDIFYWEGEQWDLPKVISKSFSKFAIFRSKTIPKMLDEIQIWLDSIEPT
jgi:DNA-binding LytR/AlgR family response regulator